MFHILKVSSYYFIERESTSFAHEGTRAGEAPLMLDFRLKDQSFQFSFH